MSLISESIPNLVNGVSQQPAALRLASQADEAVNVFPSVVEGLGKRPPTRHVVELSSAWTIGDAYIHTINRDVSERFKVIFVSGDVRVFDLEGNEKTVNFEEITDTPIDASEVAVTSSGFQYTLPPENTTITLTTTGTFDSGVTVVWEKSTTGVFGGEETTIRTDSTATSATTAWTNANYVRARMVVSGGGNVSAVTSTIVTKNSNYLVATTPSVDIAVVTVADFTFVVNKTVVGAMRSDVSVAAAVSDGIVQIKQTGNGVTFEIFIDGVSRATYQAPSPGVVSTVTATDNLKADLDTNLADVAWVLSTAYSIGDIRKNDTDKLYVVTSAGTSAGSGGPTGQGTGIVDGGVTWDFLIFAPLWTITQEQHVIHLIRNTGGDFELKTKDSRAGTHMKSAKNRVQKFTDLPNVAPKDFTVEIQGDRAQNFDNYYVKFTPDNTDATFDTGVWDETVKEGIANKIDGATVPHNLVRESDATFTFRRAVWVDRLAGDDDSAPVPSFITRKIHDVVFFKNRLGFLAGDNVILSEAGEFFNFFPVTVTTLLDGDRIDVAATGNKVNVLNHAVPFDEQMILFSDQSQFSMSGGDLLTPKTASIDLVLEFEVSKNVKPIAVGKNLYFGVKAGDFSAVREFFIDAESQSDDAADITAHVPTFIPKDLIKLAASTNNNMMVALSSNNRKKLFPYNFFWSGNEKLQSSWTEWNFNDAEVLNMDFIDDELWIIFQRTDGVFLEKMLISPGVTDGAQTGKPKFMTHLDRRMDETVPTSIVYNSGADETTWTFDFELNASATHQIVSRWNSGNDVPGIVMLGLTNPTLTTLVAPGDHSTDKVYIGEQYEKKYVFSTIHLKETARGGGQAVVGGGRLALRTFSVVYDNTGFFTATVEHTHRPGEDSVYKFTGRILGQVDDVIGEVVVTKGDFRFPVLGKNTDVTITLKNDNFLPSHFISAEWEGEFTLRSQRITARNS